MFGVQPTFALVLFDPTPTVTMQYMSFGAAVLVALLTLYSGYWRAGSYLLVRVGAAALSFLCPTDMWGGKVVLWWLPSVALASAVGGARWAILPIVAMWAHLLGWYTSQDQILQTLGLLYGLWFGLLLRREAICTVRPDDVIMMVAVVGGGITLVPAVIWGWGITLWCTLLCQIVIGAILWFRPDFSQHVVED